MLGLMQWSAKYYPKKALYELILWSETIENEEEIDHGMVSLFRHLYHVTQNCANINNTDQILLDFSNKHLFYDDENYEHLPIPVYSSIKPSTGPDFILNKILSSGIFSTKRELLLSDTLRGCFCKFQFLSGKKMILNLFRIIQMKSWIF